MCLFRSERAYSRYVYNNIITIMVGCIVYADDIGYC